MLQEWTYRHRVGLGTGFRPRMSSSAAWKVAFAFFQVSLLLVSVEALLRVSPRSSLRRGLVRATMSAFGPGEPAWTKYTVCGQGARPNPTSRNRCGIQDYCKSLTREDN